MRRGETGSELPGRGGARSRGALSYPLIGYLLLDAAELEPRKVFVANRYILSAISRAHRNADAIKNGSCSDVLHADKILI